MQNLWETQIVNSEVPRAAALGRSRDRWATSADNQNTLNTILQGRIQLQYRKIVLFFNIKN